MDVTVQSVSCLKAQKVLMNAVCGNLSALIQRRVTMLMILIRGEALNAMWQESAQQRVAESKRAVLISSTDKKKKGFFLFILSVKKICACLIILIKNI